MSMLASSTDVEHLLRIVNEQGLTSDGAALLKSTGLLSTVAKMANEHPAEDLRAVREIMQQYFANRIAGWTRDDLREIWQKHCCETPEGLVDSKRTEQEVGGESCLRYNESFTLPARKDKFNPVPFYQTVGELCIREEFKKYILHAAVKVSSVPDLEMASFDLARKFADKRIRAALPPEHVFIDTSVFCAHMFDMIKRQPNGSTGPLLGNGHGNIFYVVGVDEVVFAVRVHWDADLRRWSVIADPPADRRRRVGYRIFSRTAVS